jgi:hypothetical protein
MRDHVGRKIEKKILMRDLKFTESTQLTPMDTWVTRLGFVAFGFLYSTHMDVGYRYALAIAILI